MSQTTVTLSAAGASAWTCPSGVHSLDLVECIGGGGKGKASPASGNGAAGGAGGAYANKGGLAVIPGLAYNYQVGTGSTSNSTNGGDTWFSLTGVTPTQSNGSEGPLAKGGPTSVATTVASLSAPNATSSMGDTRNKGGNSGAGQTATGTTGAGGGGGGSGRNSANGLTGSNGAAGVGGVGGVGTGQGGTGGNAGLDGAAGSAPGAGGGGAGAGAHNGGNGADGQIVITYTNPISGSTEFSSPLGNNVIGSTIQGVPGDQLIRYQITPCNFMYSKAGTLMRFFGLSFGLGSDFNQYGVAVQRSLDNGATWGPIITIYSVTVGGLDRVSNPSPVWDTVVATTNGVGWCLFVKNASGVKTDTTTVSAPQIYAAYSTDDGLTWTVTDISANTANVTTPIPTHYGDIGNGTHYRDIGFGGIQKQFSPQSGRMIIPAYHKTANGGSFSYLDLIINDDHSTTPDPTKWVVGAQGPDTDVTTTTGIVDKVSEPMIIEIAASGLTLAQGSLYIQTRNTNGGSRSEAFSTDGGTNYGSTPTTPTDLLLRSVNGYPAYIPACEGSLWLMGTRYISVFPTGNSLQAGSGIRTRLMTYFTTDPANGLAWSGPVPVDYNMVGYSGGGAINSSESLISYQTSESDPVNGNNYIKLKTIKFNDVWLVNQSQPPYFLLPFNEYVNGTVPQNASSLNMMSGRDVGPYAGKWTLGSTGVTYSSSSPRNSGTVYLAFTSGGSLELAISGSENYALEPGESATFECHIKTTSTAAQNTILSTGNTAPYIKLYTDASGHPVLKVADANSHVDTLTGTTVLNGGDWCKVGFTINAHTKLLTILSCNSSGAPTLTNDHMTGTFVGRLAAATAEKVLLGLDQAAANPFVGGIDYVLFTRDDLTSAPLTYSYLKPTPPVLQSLSTGIWSRSPATLPGVLAWACSPLATNVWHTDQFRTDFPPLSPPDRLAYKSGFDLSTGRLFTSELNYLPPIALIGESGDANIGGACWGHNIGTAVSGPTFNVGWTVVGSGADTNFLGLHQSPRGMFSCFFKVEHLSDDATQYICDSTAAGTTPGIAVFLSNVTSTTFRFCLNVKDGTHSFNNSSDDIFSGNIGTWYHGCVIWDGNGTNPVFFLTDASLFSVAAAHQSADTLTSFTTIGTPSDMIFGGVGNDAEGPLIRMVDACISNQVPNTGNTTTTDPVTIAAVQKLFNFTRGLGGSVERGVNRGLDRGLFR